MQPMIPLCLALMLAASGAFAQSVPSFQDDSDDSQSSGELFFVIQELRQQVRQLQGQVEEQTHKIDQLSRQGRERYVDLDERILELGERLTRLEDRAAQGGSGSGGAALPQGGSDDSVAGTVSGDSGQKKRDYRQPDEQERKDYAAIQKLIQEERDYDGALDALFEFVDKYPEGDLTVNAYYWLGEVYLARENPDQARQAFSIVVSRYDDHRKAPDALYKLAVAQQQRGEKEEARKALQQVLDRYPEASVRSKARERLESL
ncbi:MAG: tol-pal system protein YbgF [Oleiphilaceae bacterium]|nr:tol-pal system protein YbgF [Oleiphilaceae bacterium]